MKSRNLFLQNESLPNNKPCDIIFWSDVIIYLFLLYRFNLFTGCLKSKTCTVILRGGAEQFMEETERSLHDAIMIVRRAMKNDSVVAGMSYIEHNLLDFDQFWHKTVLCSGDIILPKFSHDILCLPKKILVNAELCKFTQPEYIRKKKI